MEPEKEIRNMKVLKKSRRIPKEGDIFCLQLLDDKYHFGRVIKLNVIAGGFPGAKLLYFYNATSADSNDVPDLEKGDLIIPPVMTNNLGWARGYFKFLENRPLVSGDILEIHCFLSGMRKTFFDEYSNPLSKRFEPCGTFGLGSYSVIDYEISKALGLPTVED